MLFDVDESVGKVRNYQPACGVSCNKCNNCMSPKMNSIAKKKHGILFLAGEPTTMQDKEGEFFCSAYSKYLSPLIDKYDVDRASISTVFACCCHGVGLASLKMMLTYYNFSLVTI